MITKELNEDQQKDGGLQCLLIIATYYGIPADAEGLKHTFVLEDRVMKTDDILRASKKMKLKSRVTKINRFAIEKMTLPAILVLKDESFVVLAKMEKEKVLVLFPFEKAPKLLDLIELDPVWDGSIILLIPRSSKYRDIKFGFKWFIPSIIKYKKRGRKFFCVFRKIKLY